MCAASAAFLGAKYSHGVFYGRRCARRRASRREWPNIALKSGQRNIPEREGTHHSISVAFEDVQGVEHAFVCGMLVIRVPRAAIGSDEDGLGGNFADRDPAEDDADVINQMVNGGV